LWAFGSFLFLFFLIALFTAYIFFYFIAVLFFRIKVWIIRVKLLF